MTIQEAITRTNQECRNPYTDTQKIEWLTQADGIVHMDVISHYDRAVPYEGYTPTMDRNTKLLMPSPNDAGYIHFLTAQVHRCNKDLDEASQSMALFYADLDEFAKDYLQKHEPAQAGTRFIF